MREFSKSVFFCQNETYHYIDTQYMREKHAVFTDRHMDLWWTPMPKVWMQIQPISTVSKWASKCGATD